MAMSKIPILRPVVAGYADAWHAIRAMPLLAGVTVVLMFVFTLLESAVPYRASENATGSLLLSVIVSSVQNFLLTPVMIAVHRFIILGEITTRYVLAWTQHAFLNFFAWLCALSVLVLFAMSIFANEWPTAMPLAVVLVTMVVIVVILTRLSILFPAIAVAAPGAFSANAWADSKPHTLRIFLIFLLAVVPVSIGALLVMVPFVSVEGGEDRVLGIPALFIMAAIQMYAVVLCVAIASRLYQALADRLLGAPALPPQ